MKFKKGLIALRIIMIAFFSLLIGSCSSSSSPLPPIKWFNEGFVLDEHDFSPGISFFTQRDEAAECLFYTDSIVITNTSNTPLFFRAKSPWIESLEIYQPCPEDDLCVKVVSNQAWEWYVDNYLDDQPQDFAWILINRDSLSDSLVLWPSYYGLSPFGSSYSLDLFEIKNIEGFGGDMPEDLSVPESQYFELPYVYDGDEFSIGVTLTYSVNGCYPSEGPPDGKFLYNNLVICSISVVIVGIVTFMFVVIKILNRIESKAIKRINKEEN